MKSTIQTKQEAAGNSSSTLEPSKLMKPSSSTSRLWLGLKDPRIVRVSRTFGGKDRHSKVRTIKGLRDRRVRLSVPTAIQLYDLQEKLGLAQPSKVVDWLLNAAQHQIDKLPPLQFPQGINWNLDFPQSTLPFPHEIDTTSDQPRNGFDEDHQQQAWNLAQSIGFKRIDDDHRHQDQIPNNGSYMGSYFHLDPSHSRVLNLGWSNSSADSISLQHENHQYRTSSLSLVPSSQLMLCPSGTMLSKFQSYDSVASSGPDHLKNTCTGHHHYQIATSSSSPPVIPTMIFQGEPSSFLNISTKK